MAASAWRPPTKQVPRRTALAVRFRDDLKHVPFELCDGAPGYRWPEIAATITHVVAERRTRNLKARDQLDDKNQEEETKNFADQLLGKMRGFFRGIGLGD